MKNAWNGIMDILRAPFVGELDLIHLFLLVGIVLIFAAIWAVVLHYVRLSTLEA